MRYVYGIPVIQETQKHRKQTSKYLLYVYICAFVHLSFVSDVRNNQKETGTLKTSRVGM